MGGKIIFWTLLCRIWIQIHQSLCLCYAMWDTVGFFSPIVHDLSHPRLHCRRPYCTTYLIFPYHPPTWSFLCISILLYLSSNLYSTYMLLLPRPPCISATISSAIIIQRPSHLACLIPLSSSKCISPAIIIRRCLHHPTSLLPSYLFLYISDTSLLSLFPSSCVSAAIALPSCAPAPSQPPVPTE